MKKLLFLLLLVIAFIAAASEKQFQTVDARGVGITPDAALKDALAQAVQQAAGTLVDVKTLVINDQIVEDKILTASDGFIKSFEKYEEAKKNRHGLWTIRIRATVVMKPLKQKLQETKILVQNVGSSGVNQWAEIVSREASQQDVPALLEALLKKYPVESMLNVFVFDNKGRFNNLKLYFPQKGRVRDGKVRVSMGVLAVVDIEKYRKQFLPELLSLLDKVAPEKSYRVWNKGDRCDDIGFSLSPSDGCITTGRFQESWVTFIPSGRCARETIRQLERPVNGKILLGVNVSKGKYRPNVQNFLIYSFFDTPQMSKMFRRFHSNLRNLKVRLSFFDKDNNIVFFQDRRWGNEKTVYHNYTYHNYSYVVTPEFDCRQSVTVFTFDCDIPLADLKEITKVSASIIRE